MAASCGELTNYWDEFEFIVILSLVTGRSTLGNSNKSQWFDCRERCYREAS